MRTLYRRALLGTLLAGGITLLGATVANAAETTGEDGLLSGTQAIVDVTLPITVSGNAISLIGDSSSDGATVSTPDSAPAPTPAITSGADAIGSGTQALVSVDLPVTVAGNAVSVIGDSSSTDAATAEPEPEPSSAPDTTAETSGEDGILSGTQAVVSVDAPVTVAGNAVSVIGDSWTDDATVDAGTAGTGPGDVSGWTSGEDSILGGTQVIAPVTAPLTAGGNAVSVIGDSTSTGAVTTPGTGNSSTGGWTSGADSILGGTQIIAPITLPITIGGNAVSVIGDSTTHGPIVPTDPADPTDPSDPTDPADPTDPTDPTDPADPTDPTDPTDPADPTDPGDPTDPTDTGTPGTPETPGDGGSYGGSGWITGASISTAGVSTLAMTGGTGSMPALLLGALFLAAGGIARMSRRRSA